jgi:hypothetical protein
METDWDMLIAVLDSKDKKLSQKAISLEEFVAGL